MKNILEMYLKSQINNDELYINSNMLQTGLIYEFIMNFKCDGIEYECDINVQVIY